jgi:hypothetical protein
MEAAVSTESDILPMGLTQTAKNHVQDRNSNSGPPEYEAGMLRVLPQRC